jgi:hypothetical protein
MPKSVQVVVAHYALRQARLHQNEGAPDQDRVPTCNFDSECRSPMIESQPYLMSYIRHKNSAFLVDDNLTL